MGDAAKVVVVSALEGEMDSHIGYAKHDPAGRDGGNSRNGTRPKTLLTEADPSIEVPRDRESSFEPRIVAKTADERADMEWLTALIERDLGRLDVAEQLAASSVRRSINAVAPLHSVRARKRLEPPAAALEARPSSDAKELARMARQVAATRA